MNATDIHTVADLVTANHVLVRHGIVDAFGHVSVRDSTAPERFLLARSMAPALVEASDIMTFAFDGTPLGGDVRAPIAERFIHGAIYRARADVGAVVHSHAAPLIPFGIVHGVPMRPVSHMSSFLRGPVPVFEIRDVCGPDNDLLVRDITSGAALATTLSEGSAVLMRGHGATIVGRGLHEAVFRAIYTVANATLQAAAIALGSEITYLSDLEAERSAVTNEAQVERAWALWQRDDG